MNINVSLNKTLSTSISDRIKTGGYSNVSEYIRDLLRHDLKLTHSDSDYPYDYDYIERLGKGALAEYNRGETITADSVDEALKQLSD